MEDVPLPLSFSLLTSLATNGKSDCIDVQILLSFRSLSTCIYL